MITLLSKLILKNQDINTPQGRRAYGVLCSAVGIGLNLLLFAIKLTAGIISDSISIMSDAFNNLSDVGSSVITLLCFRLAGHKPDREHPFGHGRFEYISGLVVSMLVLMVLFLRLASSLHVVMFLLLWKQKACRAAKSVTVSSSRIQSCTVKSWISA